MGRRLGPNCVAALTTGELLRGTWFDRSAEYIARQRGKSVLPSQFATTFDVKLTPLPCLLHLTEDQRQAGFRRIVKEIQVAAEGKNQAKGREPMGVAAILGQDPHGRPATTNRSPAPLVHASDEKTELDFRAQYRAFVDAFRAGAQRLRDRGRELADLFPPVDAGIAKDSSQDSLVCPGPIPPRPPPPPTCPAGYQLSSPPCDCTSCMPVDGGISDAGKPDTPEICNVMCPMMACTYGYLPNPKPCGCSICAPPPDAGVAKDAGTRTPPLHRPAGSTCRGESADR